MPDTVFVASKMPIRMGPVTLNRVPVREHHALSRGPRIVGNADTEVLGGFAITVVPRAVWEEWLAANHDGAMVRNKMIWAEAEHIAIESFCAINRQSGGPTKVSPNGTWKP